MPIQNCFSVQALFVLLDFKIHHYDHVNFVESDQSAASLSVWFITYLTVLALE